MVGGRSVYAPHRYESKGIALTMPLITSVLLSARLRGNAMSEYAERPQFLNATFRRWLYLKEFRISRLQPVRSRTQEPSHGVIGNARLALQYCDYDLAVVFPSKLTACKRHRVRTRLRLATSAVSVVSSGLFAFVLPHSLAFLNFSTGNGNHATGQLFETLEMGFALCRFGFWHSQDVQQVDWRRNS
jgi:hypothetical protein